MRILPTAACSSDHPWLLPGIPTCAVQPLLAHALTAACCRDHHQGGRRLPRVHGMDTAQYVEAQALVGSGGAGAALGSKGAAHPAAWWFNRARWQGILAGHRGVSVVAAHSPCIDALLPSARLNSDGAAGRRLAAADMKKKKTRLR